MAHASEIPVGTVVRARVEGWAQAQVENRKPEPDPAVPSLGGVPEYVEGALTAMEIDTPESGLHYTKYIVDGYDIEPDSVMIL